MSSVKLSKQTVHNNYRGLIVVGGFILHTLIGVWAFDGPTFFLAMIYGNRSISVLETNEIMMLVISILITFLALLWLEYRYEKKPPYVLRNATLLTLAAIAVWGMFEFFTLGFFGLYG